MFLNCDVQLSLRPLGSVLALFACVEDLPRGRTRAKSYRVRGFLHLRTRA